LLTQFLDHDSGSVSQSINFGFACFSSAGTSVVTVTANDADDQTYGNSAKLVYSILQGQPYFSVDSENGKPNSTGILGWSLECYANRSLALHGEGIYLILSDFNRN